MKYVKDVFEVFEADETFKKRYGIAYKKLTASNMENTESVKGITVNYRLIFMLGTDLFVPTDLYVFFAIVTYPFRDSTIWDLKATDYIINNVNNLLSGTFRPCKLEPFFVRDRMLYI